MSEKENFWVHQTLLAPSQTRVDPNSISISISNDQRSMLDVHNHGMAPFYGDKITSIIEGFVYNLNENCWKYGSQKSTNLRETDKTVDFDLTVALVNKLKVGKTLKAISLTDEAEFSLQGIPVAIAEIERQIEGRM